MASQYVNYHIYLKQNIKTARLCWYLAHLVILKLSVALFAPQSQRFLSLSLFGTDCSVPARVVYSGGEMHVAAAVIPVCPRLLFTDVSVSADLGL